MAEVCFTARRSPRWVPVYERLIRKYPDPAHLLKARKTDLKEALQSLGLYWRIDLIFQMGQMMAKKFGLKVPVEKEDLLSLPGVSEYIASAVRCFAWNLPERLIDTNNGKNRWARFRLGDQG